MTTSEHSETRGGTNVDLLKRCRIFITDEVSFDAQEGHRECSECHVNLTRFEHDKNCEEGLLLTDLDAAIAAGEAEEHDVERLARKVHETYCDCHRKRTGEEYWTKGDYDKLSEEMKEYDRAVARMFLSAAPANDKVLEITIDDSYVMEYDDEGRTVEDGYFVMVDDLCSNPMTRPEALKYAASLDGARLVRKEKK
jgi:hypothetical protein